MKTILFSPIGTTDPIRNLRDGSMLHIARYYKPDIIYLYFSHEMYLRHKKDNRYVYCLEQLAKIIDHNFDIRCIIRNELIEVQKHEIFYEDFRKCINEIQSAMDKEDQLLVNISSGSPAMKNALLILSTLGEFNFTSIQVGTPLKRSNHTDEDTDNYDPQEQWECNDDNEPAQLSRCSIVHSSNLLILQNIKIIKELVRAYDYSAAYQIALGMKSRVTNECLLYLEQANERLKLNSFRVNDIAKTVCYQPMPIRKDGDRESVEFLLSLQCKEYKENYDDFIRGLSPVYVNLLARALQRQCGINYLDFCSINNEGRVRWDSNKLSGTKEEKILDNAYRGGFKRGDVYAVHLMILLRANTSNKRLITIAEDLRNIEDKARNKAAHNIVSVTQEMLIRWTGYNSNQIMDKLRKMAEWTGLVTDPAVWNSYDEMNDRVIAELDRGIVLS